MVIHAHAHIHVYTVRFKQVHWIHSCLDRCESIQIQKQKQITVKIGSSGFRRVARKITGSYTEVSGGLGP